MSIKAFYETNKRDHKSEHKAPEKKTDVKNNENESLDDAINAVLSEGFYCGSGIYYGYDGLSGVWFI